MRIEFNKNIDDSTVVASDLTIQGASGLSFSSTTAGDTANDRDIYITFTDGVLGVASTPLVSYTKGMLADLGGNLMPDQPAAAAADQADLGGTGVGWARAGGAQRKVV